jgi:DNA-binding NtrC family response regulator
MIPRLAGQGLELGDFTETFWSRLNENNISRLAQNQEHSRTEYFGMSGGELLERLTALRVTYPILVVSGSFSVSGWEAYAKRYARPHLNVSFLTKPYSMDLLQLAVRKCLGAGGHFRREE